METLLVLAGTGQLALALASPAIPRVLGWRRELARVSPLTARVFWTYAAYILGTNVSLGVVTLAFPERLLEGSELARAFSSYAACYWGGRVAAQAWYRPVAPRGRWFGAADRALTLGFVALAAVYAAAALR